MIDIDRNINSPLYEKSKITNITDLSYEISNNFKNVFSANVNSAGIWSIELQSGEYYYRHTLMPVESDNSSFFVLLYGKSSVYPLHSYYAQSPLETSANRGSSIIPYHFIIDNPIKISILVQNINLETSKIKSTIQIVKRVK